jgi:hypothetical protein
MQQLIGGQIKVSFAFADINYAMDNKFGAA